MKRKIAMIVFVLLLGMWLIAGHISWASQASELPPVAAHLKSLGYETAKEGIGLKAKHTKHFDVFVKQFGDGILFTVYLTTKESARKNKCALMEFVNALNNENTAARAYLNKDGYLVLEAWYPSAYQKSSFTVFANEWITDTTEQILQKRATEAAKFVE